MSNEIDFNKLDDVLRELAKSQSADEDNRSRSREAHTFLDKRDGQWEPSILHTHRRFGKPAYTLDKCTPIIDQIAGQLESMEFTIKVRPAGGDSTDDTASIYDGLIRNILSISNAGETFNQAGRSNVIGGIDGWEVTHDYANENSFNQDLLIKPIPNFRDRVWFDVGAQHQTMEDAQFAFVLQTIPSKRFEAEFPDKTPMSVSQDRDYNVYTNKPDFVIVGRILYKKLEQKTLVLMSNGSVYEDDEDLQKILDELASVGVVEESRRTRSVSVVHSRMFSGAEWLTEEEVTPFSYIPIIPVYGNFKISEDKVLYNGTVEKLMDSQRIYNYIVSREIEDGALSPMSKMMATQAQVQGHEEEYQSMNIDTNPVLIYNPDPQAPPPFQMGGAQVNAGLTNMAARISEDLTQSSGLYASNLGDNPNMQSGVAIDSQISQGNNSTVKWFKSMEVALCQTATVLIDAIPKIYDSKRQIRILGEDGTSKTETLYDTVLDQQTGEIIEINDLSRGVYDAVCDMGAAFKTQQQEAARAFEAVARIDPSIIAQNKDIYLATQNFKGMEEAKERARAQLFEAGQIPQDQWTDKEIQQFQEQQMLAQQQPPEESPEMVLAKAEEGKAQAELQNAAIKQQDSEGRMQLEIAKIQLENRKLDLAEQQVKLDLAKFQRSTDDKYNTDVASIQHNERKLDLQESKQRVDAIQEQEKINLNEQGQRFGQMMEIMEKQQAAINDASARMSAIIDRMNMQENDGIQQADELNDDVKE